MSENKYLPAFPVTVQYDEHGNPKGYQNGSSTGQETGLTKRELIAAKAMQGILSSDGGPEWLGVNEVSKQSVAYADALLAELSKS